ncbi:hypothetical protein F5Y13DRAFT_201145 [Hypoxylon sp. FL1857]|nr:hypothetical protein F5Y13DRAFT_201145 [Hypoxylon sp. FL1857]
MNRPDPKEGLAFKSPPDEEDLIWFSDDEDNHAPSAIPVMAPNDPSAAIDSSGNHNSPAKLSHANPESTEISLAREITKIWRDSQYVVPKAVKGFFYVEHQGVRHETFKGLPAWAVPCPKNFDYKLHVGDDKQQHLITKRLQVVIVVDPSSKQAWIKPVLDGPMVEWLMNDHRRLDAVKKLWEAYHFLCFWSFEATSSGITLPLHKALDSYYEKTILTLRARPNEMILEYNKGHTNTPVVDAKDYAVDKGIVEKDAANMNIVDKETGKPKETSYNGIGTKPECKNEEHVGNGAGSANPHPDKGEKPTPGRLTTGVGNGAMHSSRGPSIAPPSGTSSRKLAFVRSQPDADASSQTPASKTSNLSAAAPEFVPRGSQATTLPRGGTTSDYTQTYQSRQAYLASLDPKHLASPEEAIAWINAQTFSVTLTYDRQTPRSEMREQATFQHWASFFEAQLLSHDSEPREGNPWFPTDRSLHLFVRALHDVFHDRTKRTEFSPQLREWAVAVSAKLEDRERERQRRKRVAKILGRTMAGIAKEKMFVGDDK